MGKLEQWGLKIENCRGQGYDCASNMSYQVRRVQGLISEKNSKGFVVIVKACSLPTIRNMAGIITEISNFFNYSPRRQRCLENVISIDQADSGQSKICDLCCTRLVERHKAYKTFALLLPSILKTLFWMSSSTNSIVWKCPGTATERLFRRQMAAITHVARFSLVFHW